MERLPGVSEEILAFSSLGTVIHYGEFLSCVEHSLYYWMTMGQWEAGVECCVLSVKCPPLLHVFEHVVLVWWHCLGRLESSGGGISPEEAGPWGQLRF